MKLIKILAIIGLIGSIAWLVAEPGYEPALAIVAALSTLIGVFFIERNRGESPNQKQKVSGKSVGVQAGGNVNIGSNTRE